MDSTFIARLLGTPPKSSSSVQFLDKIIRRAFPWVRVDSTWRGGGMASIESRMNLFHLLSQVIAYEVQGDVVELGCNSGESSVVMQKIITTMQQNKQFHVFDSFCGVPESVSEDENVYKAGDMSVSETQFRMNFEKTELPVPIIHKGWFDDTLQPNLPEKIAFALIDCDLYDPTLLALNSVYPRLSRGAVCYFGIYWDPEGDDCLTKKMTYKSPGVKKACDEFFKEKPENISVLLSGSYTSGYFRKL